MEFLPASVFFMLDFGLNFEFGIGKPWYLLLLLFVPLIWIWSYQSLSGLGGFRRWTALFLRTLVWSLLVLTLAETQLLWKSDKLTVIYVLDQSESIPREKRQSMLEYVTREVNEHRRAEKGDRAGVIVFGGEAKVEIPPIDMEFPQIARAETAVDLKTDQTSLQSALELAKASFPEDSAKRIVIVSDGNENVGNAQALAKSMVEDDIAIDVLPVELIANEDVSVEKVVIPSNLRQGQTFDAIVVLNNDSAAAEGETTKGKLRLVERAGDSERLLAERDVELQPGKNIIAFKHELDRPAMFTYSATFVPDDPAKDFRLQNNEGSAYTHVRGKGRVLLIEDWENPGDFGALIRLLQEEKLEVDVMPSNSLFSSPADLISYDCVILANLPRASGETGDNVSSFSDEQILMLVKSVEEMGTGIVMIGGEQAFGAGGWSNTELEKAMPVDFQIKNDKVDAVGALVMVMHASELPEGNHWQKVIGREALKVLGPMDYCGVIHWNDQKGSEEWLWANQTTGLMRVGEKNNRSTMLSLLGRMVPGDMPHFEPGLAQAYTSLRNVKASMKHMIAISDGDPTPPTAATLAKFKQAGIQISTVAVGTHGPAGHQTLQDIAQKTGGKYYVAKNAKALPKIFQREARKVSKPLIIEKPEGIGVQAVGTAAVHPALQGIELQSLPPIVGYVGTTVKKNPLVEQLLIAQYPADGGENSTILASWRYGLGRTTVITTDAGKKWAGNWANREFFARFYAQIVRQSMRPVSDSANFSVATEFRDGKVRVVINAMNEKDEFINDLGMAGRAIGPKLEGKDISIRQVAPGRYEGEFEADDPGSYLFSVIPGEGYERLSGGISVAYSSEFRDKTTNRPLLETLASYKSDDIERGEVIGDDVRREMLTELLKVNTFRPNLPVTFSVQDIWPWILLVAAVCFYGDVFVRRVALDFSWIGRLRRRIFQREAVANEAEERMSRLKSKKANIDKGLAEKQSDGRYQIPTSEPPPAASANTLEQVLNDLNTKTPESKPAKTTQSSMENKEQESYTSRLLAAKKRLKKDE